VFRPTLVFLASLVFAVSSGGETRAQTRSADALTATAQLLAGVAPDTQKARFARVAQSAAWLEHQRASRAGWEKLKARLVRMDQWRAEHLPDAGVAPLVYPFSGPDFINAYALFPGRDTYVFFSLEPPGRVPDLTRLDETALAGLLADLRGAVNDIVHLNFFITPNMRQTMATDSLHGALPVMLAMMGLLDLQVLRVEPLDLWPERSAAYRAPGARRPALEMQGVQIDFHDPRIGRHQKLLYFSLDASDRALDQYPEFVEWLGNFRAPTVFLKSASYLLHGEGFGKVRDFVLDRAALVVQDDTGVPYQRFARDLWQVQLHGQYERPVKLFEKRHQKDLEGAFLAQGKTAPLPFPFGYNWRKEGKSGLIVARRDGSSS
jgi:hypothetical protein